MTFWTLRPGFKKKEDIFASTKEKIAVSKQRKADQKSTALKAAKDGTNCFFYELFCTNCLVRTFLIVGHGGVERSRGRQLQIPPGYWKK